MQAFQSVYFTTFSKLSQFSYTNNLPRSEPHASAGGDKQGSGDMQLSTVLQPKESGTSSALPVPTTDAPSQVWSLVPSKLIKKRKQEKGDVFNVARLGRDHKP